LIFDENQELSRFFPIIFEVELMENCREKQISKPKEKENKTSHLLTVGEIKSTLDKSQQRKSYFESF